MGTSRKDPSPREHGERGNFDKLSAVKPIGTGVSGPIGRGINIHAAFQPVTL
jgi:hypothetical protein